MNVKPLQSRNCYHCDNWSWVGFCVIKNIYTDFWEKCERFTEGEEDGLGS